MTEIRRDVHPSLSVHVGVRPRSPSEALEPGRAPGPPRGRRRRQSSPRVNAVVRAVSGVMTLVLVVMATFVAMSVLLFHQYEKPGPLKVSKVIAIPKGEGRIEIAQRLERDGIIASPWTFVASYLARSGWRTAPGMDLKAGEYEIKSGASMREVLDILIEGKSVLYKVTIPEGLTSEQIVARINSHEDLTGEIGTMPPEGSLLPDTYSFSKGSDRQELIARMTAEQERVLEALWQNRSPDFPLETPLQALTLASIIEKETGRADERDRVAGVFVNRLRKGMRLQSDPTIIYGIAKGKGTLDRPLTRDDIAGKTEYNTYQIDGLPPGPICNPGQAALAATLAPAKTDELYFVADGKGGHVFSKTLKEHNAAVAEWRKIEREQRSQEASEPVLVNADVARSAAEAMADDIPNPPAADGSASGQGGTATDVAAALGDAATETDSDKPVTALRRSTLPMPIRRPKR